MSSMWSNFGSDNNNAFGGQTAFTSSNNYSIDDNPNNSSAVVDQGTSHWLPRKKDILAGQRHASSKHHGNVFFKDLIKSYRKEYHAICHQDSSNTASGGINRQKKQFYMKIYLELQKLEYRFVDEDGIIAKDEKYALWRIGQALREKRYSKDGKVQPSPTGVGNFDGQRLREDRQFTTSSRRSIDTWPPYISLDDPTPVPPLRPRSRYSFGRETMNYLERVYRDDEKEDYKYKYPWDNHDEVSLEGIEPIPLNDFSRTIIIEPNNNALDDDWNRLLELLETF